MSRREKQQLLTDIGNMKDEKHNDNLQEKVDQDEIDRLEENRKNKDLIDRIGVDSNVYTAEIDLNMGINTLGQVRRQTQNEIKTQLDSQQDMIDVPEEMRRKYGDDISVRKQGPVDLKEKRIVQSQNYMTQDSMKVDLDDGDRLDLDTGTMLSMLDKEDEKDKAE